MKQHVKNFLKSRSLDACDSYYCEWCGKPSLVQRLECHHIQMKGMGGSKKLDYAENLIGLCRSDHQKAHGINGRLEREELTERVRLILETIKETK